MHIVHFLTASALCLALASCRKNGKATVDPHILNPDESADGAKSPEFQEGLLEGDMKTENGSPEDRNAVSNPNKLWPNGVVPYIFDYGTIKSDVKQKIMAAIADYSRYTCIKFQQRTNQRDYVEFNARSGGCFAYLGRSGGKQPVNLASGCHHKGTIIHELLHTLGFAHEQARNDRDNYITVNWNNINSNMHSQFKKMGAGNENNQGFKYDYSSVMHYPDWGFSKNGKPVITTRDSSKQKIIGQRKGFSDQDVKEVNKLYKCSGGNTGGSTGGNSGGNSGGGGSCYDKETRLCPQYQKKGFCTYMYKEWMKENCNKSCRYC